MPSMAKTDSTITDPPSKVPSCTADREMIGAEQVVWPSALHPCRWQEADAEVLRERIMWSKKRRKQRNSDGQQQHGRSQNETGMAKPPADTEEAVRGHGRIEPRHWLLCLSLGSSHALMISASSVRIM